MQPVFENSETLLYHGDALESLTILKDSGMRFAITFTSPPYNLGYGVKYGRYISRPYGRNQKYLRFADALTVDEYFRYHRAVLRLCMDISRYVFWNVQLVSGNKEAVFKIFGEYAGCIRDVVIWDKKSGEPAMSPGVLNRVTELILIFSASAQPGRKFPDVFFERGNLDDIWRIPRERNRFSDRHRAIQPVALPEVAIRYWTKENETILDPFCGTGTTLVAAVKNHRKAVGIDQDLTYLKISQQRVLSELQKLPRLPASSALSAPLAETEAEESAECAPPQPHRTDGDNC